MKSLHVGTHLGIEKVWEKQPLIELFHSSRHSYIKGLYWFKADLTRSSMWSVMLTMNDNQCPWPREAQTSEIEQSTIIHLYYPINLDKKILILVCGIVVRVYHSWSWGTIYRYKVICAPFLLKFNILKIVKYEKRTTVLE